MNNWNTSLHAGEFPSGAPKQDAARTKGRGAQVREMKSSSRTSRGKSRSRAGAFCFP